VLPASDQANAWRLAKSPWVSALSQFQWSAFPELQPSAVIHHGVDPEEFTFTAVPSDYVCYLGRFMPEKGPLVAIEAARAIGVRLLLAGPPNPYYHRHIEPLVDGRSVEYVGYVTGRERDQLLGHARALLYPLQSSEPFGLVVAEAMMCGTPVVTTRLGAVSELVDDGVTGYLAASPEEFIQQLPQSFSLDRHRIRRLAESRFTARRMAEQYASLYERVLRCSSPSNGPRSRGTQP
jgi:glycosyltransferase involved in cell wall biosynthesis